MDVTLAILKQIIGDLYIENTMLRNRLEILTLELQQTKEQIETISRTEETEE